MRGSGAESRMLPERRTGSPEGLPVLLYDVEKGEGKYSVVRSSDVLDDFMIAPKNRKSMTRSKASQFVYKQLKIADFIHKMFKKRSKTGKDFGLTQGSKKHNI